jgi:hypothetical protein
VVGEDGVEEVEELSVVLVEHGGDEEGEGRQERDRGQQGGKGERSGEIDAAVGTKATDRLPFIRPARL